MNKGGHFKCSVAEGLSFFVTIGYEAMISVDITQIQWCGDIGERASITHTVTLRVTGRVALVSGVLFALLGAQSTLNCLKQHRIQVPILS